MTLTMPIKRLSAKNAIRECSRLKGLRIDIGTKSIPAITAVEYFRFEKQADRRITMSAGQCCSTIASKIYGIKSHKYGSKKVIAQAAATKRVAEKSCEIEYCGNLLAASYPLKMT